MSGIEYLGLALALATLAGVYLYLTAFMVGLAVRLEWPAFAETAALDGFSNPAVMGVALVLFLVEFLVDKVPWADSLWDSIHTFIRPAGGALLALCALSPTAGGFAGAGVAVLAVSASLLAHSTKAGIRLRINTSPEPFSNIIASVIEDVLVACGFWLAGSSPGAALPVFVVVLVLFGIAAPKLYRSSMAVLWLIWRKLRVPAGKAAAGSDELPTALASDDESALSEFLGNVAVESVFAQFCVTGKVRGVPGLAPHLRGHLVALKGRRGELYFVGRKGWRGRRALAIDIAGAAASHDSRFLSETIVISCTADKCLLNFHLHRGQSALAEALADYLQEGGDAVAEETVVDAEEAPKEDASEVARVEAPAEELDEGGIGVLFRPEGEGSEDDASAGEVEGAADPIEGAGGDEDSVRHT
jgi:hypothetical protein